MDSFLPSLHTTPKSLETSFSSPIQFRIFFFPAPIPHVWLVVDSFSPSIGLFSLHLIFEEGEYPVFFSLGSAAAARVLGLGSPSPPADMAKRRSRFSFARYIGCESAWIRGNMQFLGFADQEKDLSLEGQFVGQLESPDFLASFYDFLLDNGPRFMITRQKLEQNKIEITSRVLMNFSIVYLYCLSSFGIGNSHCSQSQLFFIEGIALFFCQVELLPKPKSGQDGRCKDCFHLCFIMNPVNCAAVLLYIGALQWR